MLVEAFTRSHRELAAFVVAGVAAEAAGTTHAPLVTGPTQKRAGLDSGCCTVVPGAMQAIRVRRVSFHAAASVLALRSHPAQV